MNEITTTDLSKFGYRELDLLNILLTGMKEQGLPEDFYNDEVVPMMNLNSGSVFLTNSDFQVAMMNGADLESYYSLPYSGEEGFKDDFEGRDKEEFEQDDIEVLTSIGVFEVVEDVEE